MSVNHGWVIDGAALPADAHGTYTRAADGQWVRPPVATAAAPCCPRCRSPRVHCFCATCGVDRQWRPAGAVRRAARWVAGNLWPCTVGGLSVAAGLWCGCGWPLSVVGGITNGVIARWTSRTSRYKSDLDAALSRRID